MLELVLRGLLSLGQAVLELLAGYFFYACGWLVLRLLTLGRYPHLPLRVDDPEGSRSNWVAAFGLVCVLGAALTALVLIYG